MSKSIYDTNDLALMSIEELETVLKEHLLNLYLGGYAIRTRSKIVKSEVCKALDCDVPETFRKTQPRFPCQNLDVMTQKSNNIQIWNEEVDSNRRYAILKVDENDRVVNLKVISGAILNKLDKTGKLTQKYQALLPLDESGGLFSNTDTFALKRYLGLPNLYYSSPISLPEIGKVFPIQDVYEKLLSLIGNEIPLLSQDQERNRGFELHKRICNALGYSSYLDNGQYPDIRHQLIEVKLQTSQTIDLGEHEPNDNQVVVNELKSKDVRYVIFYGQVKGNKIVLTKLFVVNGEDFYKLCKPMKGINKKIQLPIPSNFFN